MRTLLSTSRCKPSSPSGSPRLGLGVPPDQEAERRTARPTRIKEDEDGGGRGGWSSSCQQQRHHGQSRRRRGRWTDRWQVAPPPICLLTPALLYTLSLTPHPLPHSHPSILPCYHLSPRCQKVKRCGNTCGTTECSKPPPQPPQPPLPYI